MSEVRDPVCNQLIDPLRARAVGIFEGVTCYFCSESCKDRYRRTDPNLLAVKTTRPTPVIAAADAVPVPVQDLPTQLVDPLPPPRPEKIARRFGARELKWLTAGVLMLVGGLMLWGLVLR